ncbi:transcriptional regulator, LuxR family [Aneurinibacillus aneurinilyticus ATCC 12856]|uniref:Transcriptional regulator, LuxR family n=3 Tax=Paenibacillaceae TaxID=186822 RepID=U1WSS4_ANEAE|nr:transcriptional regulator, LuxR family [Aneurinibacillus aneurinilyticus ATCC 12856]
MDIHMENKWPLKDTNLYLCESCKIKSFLNQRIKSNIFLTEMEKKVAEELIKDKSNQEIADSLFISKRTVEYHITSAIQKLGVKSRVGLAVKIIEAGSSTNYCECHQKIDPLGKKTMR